MSRSLSPIRVRALLVSLLVALSGSLALQPAAAGAAPAPNQTQFSVDLLVSLGMTAGGVKLTPIAPATQGLGGLYFPVTSSSASGAFTGTVKHSGGFQLQYGNLKIGFRNPTINVRPGTPARGWLSAEPVVNGIVVPFQFPISEVSVTSARSTGGLVLGKTKVVIDRNIVALVNSVIGVNILKVDQPWATTETRVAASAG
ncbi:MAG: hypothetical protein PGN13_12750 [Patulibacter minatonensis]